MFTIRHQDAEQRKVYEIRVLNIDQTDWRYNVTVDVQGRTGESARHVYIFKESVITQGRKWLSRVNLLKIYSDGVEVITPFIELRQTQVPAMQKDNPLSRFAIARNRALRLASQLRIPSLKSIGKTAVIIFSIQGLSSVLRGVPIADIKRMLVENGGKLTQGVGQMARQGAIRH